MDVFAAPPAKAVSPTSQSTGNGDRAGLACQERDRCEDAIGSAHGEAKRPLEDTTSGNESNDQREMKRPKLHSSDYPDASLGQSGDSSVDGGIAKVHNSRHSLVPDRLRSSSIAARFVSLISPPAINHSNTTISSPQQSPFRLEDATKVDAAKTDVIKLRATLFQIYSIIQNLAEQLQRHCDIPGPYATPESNDEASTDMDEHTNSSESGDDDGDENDVYDDNRNARPSRQRRRLSLLEEQRVRAWQKEGKSKSWIKSKLRESELTSSQPQQNSRARCISQTDKPLAKPKAGAKKHSRIEERKKRHTRSPQTAIQVQRDSRARARAVFTPDQDRLLIELKESRNKLSWKKIHQQFIATYPWRSRNTLQVHYCTKLKRREEADIASDLDA